MFLAGIACVATSNADDLSRIAKIDGSGPGWVVLGKDDFARGLTEALVAYSLGRSFAFTDEDLANNIINAAKNKNYALSEFLHAVVESKEFQSK